eukprot:358354-Chlamydomonas_euryale.AAC.4
MRRDCSLCSTGGLWPTSGDQEICRLNPNGLATAGWAAAAPQEIASFQEIQRRRTGPGCDAAGAVRAALGSCRPAAEVAASLSVVMRWSILLMLVSASTTSADAPHLPRPPSQQRPAESPRKLYTVRLAQTPSHFHGRW